MEVVSLGTIHVAVSDATLVADARRRVAILADALGFGETQGGRAAIVATELATNLLKHAGGGELYVAAHTNGGKHAIDIISADRGMGMSDVDACIRDGYSTAGSQGTGLGAISRLTARLDIHSVVGKGTVVHARVLAGTQHRSDAREVADIFGLSLPHPYEAVCGDSWLALADDDTFIVAVFDGLGHGPSAAEAAVMAVDTIRPHRSASPAELLERVHVALVRSRGAVGGIARIDLGRSIITYAGIGNIAAMTVSSGETKRLMSHNGTLGSNVRRFQSLEYPFARHAIFVLSSDGLASQVDVVKLPGLAQKGAPVIAGRLMTDFRRGRDDATVVVLKEARSD